MRRTLLALVLTLSACATTRPAPAPASPAVQAEIRQALARWNEATARGDLAGVMSQLDDAPDVLVVGSDKGEIFLGRAAIQGWLGKILPKNRFEWQMDRVEISSSGDTAWVFVDGAMIVKNPAGAVRRRTPYRFSAVLVRRGEGWAWRLFDGSIPAGE